MDHLQSATPLCPAPLAATARAAFPMLPAGQLAIPLHDVAATRAIEQEAAARLPAHTLMQRAGEAAARLTLALAPHARQVWVACGPGNNGGDGLVAALTLHLAGKPVCVTLCGDPDKLPDDARHAWQRVQHAGVPMELPGSSAPPHDFVLDALLGIGTSRPAQGALADVVRQLNASAAPVLAVDLPTGLHAETGAVLSAAAVRATHTLSLLTLKPGLFTGQGRDHAGRVWLETLGVEATHAPSAMLTGTNVTEALRRGLAHSTHKGSFGDVLIIGGDEGMTGAAALSAEAALRAGAGRVYVDALTPTTMSGDAGVMWQPGRGQHVEHMAHTTVVCGCGGGEAVAERLPMVLAHAARLVLDADAINAVAREAPLARALAHRGRQGLPTLLTPHPLEAARLLKTTAKEVQWDRVHAARRLADDFHCAVLLKGSGSVCVSPGGIPWINPTGNALLATAGTGDVLAGWTGGAWASCGGCDLDSGLHTAVATAYLQGLAADLAWSRGLRSPLVASALAKDMAQALNAAAR